MFRTAQFSAAAVASALLAAPGVAGAQSYYVQSYPYAAHGGYAQYYRYRQNRYDPCTRDQRQRQTAGGLVGATIGAVAGSQLAARGRRTEGSLLGGVVGALIGTGVGRSSAACDRGGYYASDPYAADPYGQPGYTQGAYGSDYGNRPDDRYQPRDYGSAYGSDDRYDDRYSSAYGQGGYDDYDSGYRQDDGYGQNDCQMSESSVRLPDGRVESRYVRTCPDSSGRYRIVD